MKKSLKIVIILAAAIFAMIIFQGKVSAANGYTIENYGIVMKVNENNTFDITEIIETNFTQSKHGIYRKIPVRNTVRRLDGTSSKNRARVSNIKVNTTYQTSVEDGYKVIKIGDADKTVIGKQTYQISYTYDLGKDPLENADEIYSNLIGTEWDTSISNVDFTVIMPKEFDKSLLGFSSGYAGSSNALNVQFTVEGNVITGKTLTYLSSGEGLTMRCELPEGYFTYVMRINYIAIAEIAVYLTFVIIAFVLWTKYGRDEKEVETVEFYPPDNMNSIELAYFYKGYVMRQDGISLLIHLANKGYIRIEESEEKVLKLFKSKDFKIIKVKEYDGNNPEEKLFFKGLFLYGDVVSKSDLQDSFYRTLDRVVRSVGRKENKEKLYDKTSLNKRIIAILFTIILAAECFMSNVIRISSYGYLEPLEIASAVIGIISGIALVVFSIIIKKRTKYGVEILGKIKGFKNFLETAEKDKLEALVEENPQYFFNILPYTYVLGVSNKWMEKFEDIAMEPPSWYSSPSAFDMVMFNSFMNSTYSSISSAMTSSPSDSGGGGSGGGFSGGGSGGGRRRLLVKDKILLFYDNLPKSLE